MIMPIPDGFTSGCTDVKRKPTWRCSRWAGSRYFQGQRPVIMPEPEEVLQQGDRLVLEGRPHDLEILQGLEALEIERRSLPDVQKLVSEKVGLVEAILSPQSTLEGKTLRQINFREKFGLSVLALWRRGRAYRSDLRDMELRFGDASCCWGSP